VGPVCSIYTSWVVGFQPVKTAAATGIHRERDSGQHHEHTRELSHSGAVAEAEPAHGRADDRLQIQHGSGDLRAHARLSGGEEDERQHGAGERQDRERGGRRDAGRRWGRTAEQRDRERHQRRGAELRRGHGGCVSAGEHPWLNHDERR